MYIVGKYYQGNPDQKPEQWGSIADVQYAVRHNCEEWLGVDSKKLKAVYPFWENTGIPQNIISQKKIQSLYGKWVHNKIYAKSINTNYELLRTEGDGIGSNFSDQFSLIFLDLITLNKYQHFYLFNIEDYWGANNIRFYTSGSSNQTLALKNRLDGINYDFLSIHLDLFTYNVVDKTESFILNFNKNNFIEIYGQGKYQYAFTAENCGFVPDLSENYSINIGQNDNNSCVVGCGACILIDDVRISKDQNLLLNDQPYKLFEPVSRPIYFDFTDLPESPEYASVISEKVNTISEFQKEGLFSSTLSEKTNLISGFEKQAEISSVLAETINNTQFFKKAGQFDSQTNESLNTFSDFKKASDIESVLSENTNLETEVKKTGYFASELSETINTVSTFSSSDIEKHSFSSSMTETVNTDAEFFKKAAVESIVSEGCFFSSNFYKNSFFNSELDETINTVFSFAGAILERPIINTSFTIRQDSFSVNVSDNNYKFIVIQNNYTFETSEGGVE